MNQLYQSKQSKVLEKCPDCISIIENNILISTYDFIDDNTKTGNLWLMDKNLNILQEFLTDGILHFKLVKNIITLCTWKGECIQIQVEENKFNKKNTISFIPQFQNIKLLYLDCDEQSNLIVGGDNGEVIFSQENQVIFSQKSHDYSVWCTLIDSTDNNLFYSGSDDACLNYYDKRIGLIRKDKKSHSQGVTYLLRDNQFDLITASFDGKIRIFDIRQPNPKQEIIREDGIWRIIKRDNQYFNGLFQAQKYELIEINENEIKSLQTFNEHQSLAYAMDWKDNFIVTSSFYDKILRTYEID